MFSTRNNLYGSADLYTQLLAHLPSGVMVLLPSREKNGKITDFLFAYLNPVGEQITGCKQADLEEKTLLQLFPVQATNGIFNRYVKVFETGRNDLLEYLHDNGERRRWFRIHCVKFDQGLLTTFEDITDQKRTENELRENQIFIQSVAEAVPEVIYVYDLLAGRNVYVNRRLEEMLGYGTDSAGEADFQSLVHPDDWPIIENRFQKFEHIADNEVIEDEYRMRAADKTWHWIYSRGVVFRRTWEGKVWQIVGASRDITSRKRIEEELRQQQHLLATIADATPDIILLVDLVEDRVVYANRQIGRSLAIPATPFAAMTGTERKRWMLEEDLLKRTAFLRGFAEAHDNEIREAEYRIKDAEGQWKWIWTRGKVFRRLPNGRVWQIIMVGQDVTEKKENQRQIRLANEELKIQQENLQDLNNELEARVQIRTHELAESSRRFQTLLEAMPQMAWTALPNGSVNYYNQQWYNYTGSSLDVVTGEGWKAVMHPEDVEASYQKWLQSVQTGEPFEYSNRFRRATDGSWRWHLTRAIPIRDSAGNIALWVGTCTDMHDQRMALENMSHVNAVLDNFVHMAAHDLKSPVNNLKALFQLHRMAKNEEDAAPLFAAMEESVHRLDNTVESLVEVLEVQHHYEIPARQVFFQEVVDNLMKDYSGELEKCQGSVTTDFSSCPSIFYVEAYLSSIVRNLVSNAIKYRSQRHNLVVKLSTARLADAIVLRVEDNGMGIDLKKYGKSLFNPFSRFTTQAYGKGLGLHLVKNMVEKNGGHIQVESEVDVGTTFVITLKEYTPNRE